MRLQIAKWGNSLAVRLPVDYVRTAGLKDGDGVEGTIGPTGEITLVPERPFDKASFLTRVAALQGTMPMGASVVERMRQEAPY